MRSFLGSTLALTFALAAASSFSPAALAASKAPGVFVNLTHGQRDLHATSMGLALAKSALEKGHSVVVFLNVDAATLADKTLSPDVRFADFAPVPSLVQELIDGGAKMFVCGHCAKVVKLDPKDIRPGIKVARHGDLLDAMTAGMVSFSY
jgi:predicted peroxiredoxin